MLKAIAVFGLSLVQAQKVTQKAYFDMEIDGEPAGRIVFGLYGDVVPKTVANFAALCDGSSGVGNQGKPLHYKGTEFFGGIQGVSIMGGDIISNDGKGGESIYGGRFPDENHDINFRKPYMLSMLPSEKKK